MKSRPVALLRAQLSEFLDKMEKVEENGHIEEVVILGAFADGIAYALGEDLADDYFEQANLLSKSETNPPEKKGMKVV